MTRIRIESPIRSPASIVLGLLFGVAACGPQVGPGRNRVDDAIIVVKSNVRDAQVYIDGKFIAPLNAIGGGIAILPGPHRFELRHDDYFSSYAELTIVRAEHKKLAIDLAPVLP